MGFFSSHQRGESIPDHARRVRPLLWRRLQAAWPAAGQLDSQKLSVVTMVLAAAGRPSRPLKGRAVARRAVRCGSSGTVGQPEQGDYIVGPRGAVDSAASSTAPRHEGFDIHHDFADGVSLRFEFVECGQRVALPLLESGIQLVTVVHDLGEALPLHTRKPREADLRGGRN